jgi:dephospho-CoA kinase
MIVLGITGAIASGKSTVASIFAESGIPVFNADAVVHGYYLENPRAIIDAFPDAAPAGKVERRRLAAIVERDASAIDRLEAIIHPIVRDAAGTFVRDAERAGERLSVLEIPLLFESGMDALCDKVLITTADAATRELRVARRGTMSAELYRRLSDRQMPERGKLARADFVVHTAADLGDVRRRVGDIISALTATASDG